MYLYQVKEELHKVQRISHTVCDICKKKEEGEPKNWKVIRKRYDNDLLNICSESCLVDGLKKLFPTLEYYLIMLGNYVGSEGIYKMIRTFIKELEIYPDLHERD